MARDKSADGQGSIYPIKDKAGKVLRYRWEVMVGWLPGGKKDVRRGSAKTQGEARKTLTRVASQKDAHSLPAASASKRTVADQLTDYLRQVRLEASTKTYKKEEQFANLHVIPAIGKLRLQSLKAVHVRDLLTGLAEARLAPATIKGIRGTLARALDQAVIDDVLPRNVARLERKKRSRRATSTGDDKFSFTPADVAAICQGSLAGRFHPLWVTLLYTGMRFGEAAGLTWRDYDPIARTLTISRSLERASGGEPVFSDPKTYASRRTIILPAAVVALLNAHRSTQAQEKLDARVTDDRGRVVDQYRNHGLIFASAYGAPLMHSNIYRSFKGLLGRLELTVTSPHTCRHTAATNMLYAGVPLNEVSHILGHANTAVTAQVYSHALPRGGGPAWTPPAGLRGLDLLAAWYARAMFPTVEADQVALPSSPASSPVTTQPVEHAPLAEALSRYN